jgi:hypothetical protein
MPILQFGCLGLDRDPILFIGKIMWEIRLEYYLKRAPIPLTIMVQGEPYPLSMTSMDIIV